MRLPTFDLNTAYYDEWKMFYIPHGPSSGYSKSSGAVIQLQTGAEPHMGP